MKPPVLELEFFLLFFFDNIFFPSYAAHMHTFDGVIGCVLINVCKQKTCAGPLLTVHACPSVAGGLVLDEAYYIKLCLITYPAFTYLPVIIKTQIQYSRIFEPKNLVFSIPL